MIVHAETKVGKSTFANTTPAPRLLLDSEAAYRFLPGTKVFWDPLRDEPPIIGQGRIDPADPTVYQVDWETCVVIVRDYTVMIRAVEWLTSGRHPFVSVVVDSISEIQKRCKDNIRSLDEQMDQRRWGSLLDHMEALVRTLRDLTEHPTKPIQAIVLTAMTSQRDGKWRPYVQGQLATTMPYFLDVIGYLYKQDIPSDDPSQPAHRVRRLLTANHPQFEAGERVQGRLPDVLDNPTVPMILDMVFGQNGEVA
jgi:AAA domain-containing protein